jgi:hypothetical protein
MLAFRDAGVRLDEMEARVAAGLFVPSRFPCLYAGD